MLIQILKEPKNALTKQYGALFAMEGAELELRDDALHAIAAVMERNTGARFGSIVEDVLLDTMYELPGKFEVTKVVIDESTVKGDSEPLLFTKRVKKLFQSNRVTCKKARSSGFFYSILRSIHW